MCSFFCSVLGTKEEWLVNQGEFQHVGRLGIIWIWSRGDSWYKRIEAGSSENVQVDCSTANKNLKPTDTSGSRLGARRMCSWTAPLPIKILSHRRRLILGCNVGPTHTTLVEGVKASAWIFQLLKFVFSCDQRSCWKWEEWRHSGELLAVTCWPSTTGDDGLCHEWTT